MGKAFLLFVVVFSLVGLVHSQEFKGVAFEDRKLLEGVIATYNRGLTGSDAKLMLSSIGSEFTIFNGNFTSDTTKWEAHLFRTGDGLKTYISNFLNGAGPHENKYKILHMHIRSDAALVVTSDTGRNKFRTWTDENVTWLLGKREGVWKISGYFIRDIKNPG